MNPLFVDRIDAGRQLSKALSHLKGSPDAVSVGLARGGIVPAFVLSRALEIPLDVIVPRKVGAPFNPELAIAAVTESGAAFFNEELIETLGITEDLLETELKKEKKNAEERLKLYRTVLPATSFKDKILLLVDDGLATGATMKASIRAAKDSGAKEILAVVPVSPPETALEIEASGAGVLTLATPPNFQAVGQFYMHFPPVEDDEVLSLLKSV